MSMKLGVVKSSIKQIKDSDIMWIGGKNKGKAHVKRKDNQTTLIALPGSSINDARICNKTGEVVNIRISDKDKSYVTVVKINEELYYVKGICIIPIHGIGQAHTKKDIRRIFSEVKPVLVGCEKQGCTNRRGSDMCKICPKMWFKPGGNVKLVDEKSKYIMYIGVGTNGTYYNEIEMNKQWY